MALQVTAAARRPGPAVPALGRPAGGVAGRPAGRAAARHLPARRAVRAPARPGLRDQGGRASALARARVPAAARPGPARRPARRGGRRRARTRERRRRAARAGAHHPAPAVLAAVPRAVLVRRCGRTPPTGCSTRCRCCSSGCTCPASPGTTARCRTRCSAGTPATFAAYLVDAETGELHEHLSDGQREYDLEVARTNIFGELLDLRGRRACCTSRSTPSHTADAVVRRYHRLWDELTEPLEVIAGRAATSSTRGSAGSTTSASTWPSSRSSARRAAADRPGPAEGRRRGPPLAGGCCG